MGVAIYQVLNERRTDESEARAALTPGWRARYRREGLFPVAGSARAWASSDPMSPPKLHQAGDPSLRRATVYVT